MKKGKNVYVPREVLDLMEQIKREDNLRVGSEAFRHMVHYAKKGRKRGILDILEPQKKKKRGKMVGFI